MDISKNFATLQRRYKEDTYVIDSSFLTEDTCKKLTNFLDTMDKTWWYHSSMTGEGKKEIRRLPENLATIKERRDEAQKLFSTETFSYSFDRTIGNHYETCRCQLCSFDKNVIKSDEFREYIERVTGQTGLKLGTFFYTRYNAGDFLYPHTDSPNGKVALVLHLTQNWKPWYGGNLCLLGNKWRSVRKLLVPRYNSLMVMDIVNKKNPHFVEYIPEFVKEPRYAMVCWFE